MLPTTATIVIKEGVVTRVYASRVRLRVCGSHSGRSASSLLVREYPYSRSVQESGRPWAQRDFDHVAGLYVEVDGCGYPVPLLTEPPHDDHIGIEFT